ncbi:MAG: transposase [Planctomycetota bacterium]|nr:transposase [Planctomycetota bacterium]
MGLDEIRLKKRQKLYVTLTTDLTDPESPKVLAVVRGKDTAVAKKCLAKLTPRQRAAVQTRVITKRCYGVKSSNTLFSRLILDLNRASEAAGRSIGELRQIVGDLKAVFLAFCT